MSANITQVAEQLNLKVSQLNNERSRQIGMLEAAKKQYENAVQTYEAKFGVKLTEANLQEEYNKVYAEVKGKVAHLQENITSIERGDYKNVERPKDIDLEPNVEPIKPVEAVQTAPIGIVQAVGEMVTQTDRQDVVNTSPIVAPVQPQTIAPTPIAPQPIAPEVKPTIDIGAMNNAAQTQAKPAVFGGQPLDFSGDDFGGDDAGEEEDESFTPEGWGTPKGADEINKNFADILGQQGVKFGN